MVGRVRARVSRVRIRVSRVRVRSSSSGLSLVEIQRACDHTETKLTMECLCIKIEIRFRILKQTMKFLTHWVSMFLGTFWKHSTRS